MSKIAIDLDNLTGKLGFDAVISAYPEFREFYTEFAVARKKIADSRRNRGSRNDVYRALTATDLPNLTDRYEKLMAARPIAKWNAFKIKVGGFWTVLIGIAAIAGAIFVGLTWYGPIGTESADRSQIEAPSSALQPPVSTPTSNDSAG
jgi:hypothetical protein